MKELDDFNKLCKEIAEERDSIDESVSNLQETSLGRIWQGMNNPDIAMAFFSAFRKFKEKENGEKVEVSLKENLQRTKILRQLVAQKGWGFSVVKGAWTDSETGRVVTELSLVVRVSKDNASNLKGFLRKLTKSNVSGVRDGGNPEAGTFDQDAVIFKPVDSDEAFLITNDGQEFSIGKFHPNVIADNFTKVKNATFTFKEGAHEYIPEGWAANLKKSYSNKK